MMHEGLFQLHFENVVYHSEDCHLFYNRESDITKERVQKILATGANVILTTGGIDDLCLKYFVESGAMAVRRCKKVDLRRIAKATGGCTDILNKTHCYCIRLHYRHVKE